MSEYISREEAEKAISIYANPNIDSKAVLSHVSSADVRPNIHGHWELNERGIWNCPKCGTEVYDGDCDKFCRVCGADFKYTPHEQMMIEPKGEKGD